MGSVENTKFQSFFGKIYGDRWPILYKALQDNERQVRRHNFFAGSSPQDELPWLSACEWQTEQSTPARTESGLLDVYVMDPASVIVARALEVQDGDRVLDMCAAPGGKTLVLAEGLRENGELIANETSPSRRDRLMNVIRQYLPQGVRSRVWVKGVDGLQYGMREPEGYDRILVDAPCSGERHLLENPKELEGWTENRTKSLAQKQYGLMTSALLALKPGGRLVYSTCSISPYENDGVIERLLKKKSDQFEVVKVAAPTEFAEEAEYGWMHLPDCAGFGPLYFVVLQKCE